MGENKHLGARKMKSEEGPKIQVDDHYFRHVDQMQRWRQEYEHSQTVENKIASLSKFQYEAIDYNSLLERVPYKEREIPNFDYLLDEARKATEKKFIFPIIQRAVVALVLLVTLILSGNLVMLWIAGTLAFAVLASIFLVMHQKEKALTQARMDAELEIRKRREQAKKVNDEARAEHERGENERITSIEHLLSGEMGAIILKLDSVIKTLSIPFPLKVDIDLYRDIPFIQVWLPPKSIVPNQICELNPSGRPQYQDKDLLQINKQYLELCAATILQVMAMAYVHVPFFDRGYAVGCTKDGINIDHDCKFFVGFTREALERVLNSASNGLSAMQMLQAKFSCDPSLQLEGFDWPTPPEWEGTDKKDLRSIHVKINYGHDSDL